MLRVVTLAVVLLVLGGACSFVGEPPPPGTRPMPARIKNLSAVPIELGIRLPTGVLPGAVQPASIPAGVTQEVMLYLPPGRDWEMTVNGEGWLPATDFESQQFPAGCRLDMEINNDGSGSWGCHR